jgi:hypothetical protein
MSFRHGAFCFGVQEKCLGSTGEFDRLYRGILTEVRDLAAKIFGRTLVRAIYALIKADWNKYGLEVITGDSQSEKLVVPIKKH